MDGVHCVCLWVVVVLVRQRSICLPMMRDARPLLQSMSLFTENAEELRHARQSY